RPVCGCETSRSGPWGPLRARRRCAQSCKSSTHHRSAHRYDNGSAYLGGPLRGRTGRWFGFAGREDAFNLQDRVTASVVGAIAPKLEQAEIERAKREPTESLDAYDYYLRGLARTRHWSKEANGEALHMFYKAIELDPDFASAHGMAAWCHCQRKAFRWVTNRSQEIADTTRLARRAVELGRDDRVR